MALVQSIFASEEIIFDNLIENPSGERNGEDGKLMLIARKTMFFSGINYKRLAHKSRTISAKRGLLRERQESQLKFRLLLIDEAGN